jgi:DNA-binding response OmpR family regulator
MLILVVVEDDQLIQSLVEQALSDNGFDIAIACSGEEAVALLMKGKSNYRMLVTDIKVGSSKVNGWEVARHARAIDPAFPVVYISDAGAGEWRGVPNSVICPSRSRPRCLPPFPALMRVHKVS